jgi:hypothetical protein
VAAGNRQRDIYDHLLRLTVASAAAIAIAMCGSVGGAHAEEICGNDPSYLKPFLSEPFAPSKGREGARREVDVVFKFEGSHPCDAGSCKLLLMDAKQETTFAEIALDSDNVEYCTDLDVGVENRPLEQNPFCRGLYPFDFRRVITGNRTINILSTRMKTPRRPNPAWMCIEPSTVDLECGRDEPRSDCVQHYASKFNAASGASIELNEHRAIRESGLVRIFRTWKFDPKPHLTDWLP